MSSEVRKRQKNADIDFETQFDKVNADYESFRTRSQKEKTEKRKDKSINPRQNDKDNCKRLALDCSIQLLQLNLKQKIKSCEKDGDDISKLEDINKKIDLLRNSSDYKITTKFRTKKQFSILGFSRFIGVVLYMFFLCLPAMCIVFPIRFLNPLFRKIGIKNNDLPSDKIIHFFARSVCFLSGVYVNKEGVENIDCEQNYICMFSHASNFDPFIVQAASPHVFKWIGKKEIMFIPIFGFIFWAYGNIFIDRSNKTRAINSLKAAVTKIDTYRRSVAISPEGTRSRTGLMNDFKKGPFHTTIQAKLPVLPVVIYGAHERWPSGQTYATTGHCTARFLKPIEYDKNITVDDLLIKVQRQVLEEMSNLENIPYHGEPITGIRRNSLIVMHSLVYLIFVYVYLYLPFSYFFL